MIEVNNLLQSISSNLEYVFLIFIPRLFVNPSEQLNILMSFVINGHWWIKMLAFSGVLAGIKIITYNLFNKPLATLLQLCVLITGLVITYQLGLIIFIY